jgi:hypothetical protein
MIANDYHDLNTFIEIVKQIIINIKTEIEIEVTIAV